MRVAREITVLGLCLGLGFGSTADAGKNKKGAIPTDLMLPTTNLHMRAAFDTDPSTYLGRFMPQEELALLDESSARKTQCSQHISWQEIDGGGVSYNEIFQVSNSLALGFNIPNTMVGVGGGFDGSTALRAKYRLTSKMVADVSDPVAFGLCCQESSEACPGEFVSEFIGAHAGQIYYIKETGLSLRAQQKLLVTDTQFLDAERGTLWSQSRDWESDKAVYFAFRTTKVPQLDCTELVDRPPESPDRYYFGAVSNEKETEQLARDEAMDIARESVVKWLGEEIRTGSYKAVREDGSASQLSSKMNDQGFVERISEGVASRVKSTWVCPVEQIDGGVNRYKVRLLAHVPKASVDEVVVEALGEE